MTLQYKTEVFEGPLDLLLTLISKHKLNIYDINIFELVTQYTEQIKLMQQNDMEISSEFLEMAARLVYIKTVYLLPTDNDGEKLKEELQGELIEYMDCKIIASKLAELTDGFTGFVREPVPVEADWTYRRHHDPVDLLNAFFDAAGKKLRRLPPTQDAFSAIVKKAVVSVGRKITGIYNLVKSRGRLFLSDIYSSSSSRSELVASFLAVLEMAKNGQIKLGGEGLNLYAETGSASAETISEEFDDYE